MDLIPFRVLGREWLTARWGELIHYRTAAGVQVVFNGALISGKVVAEHKIRQCL